MISAHTAQEEEGAETEPRGLLTSSFTLRLISLPKSLKVTSWNLRKKQLLKIKYFIFSHLGMLILSFMILDVTFDVKLKMESLSGLTDLVVSITNTRGGLRTFPALFPRPDPDWGQS